MKKIILSIIFSIVLNIGASAQIDNIITDWDDSRSILDEMPWLPAVNVGSIYDDIPAYNGPLGDGLLIFTMLGMGYMISRRKHMQK